MLDINRMQRQFEAAIERFVEEATAIAREYLSQKQPQSRRAAPAPAAAPRKPVRKARPPRAAGPVYRAPLVPVAAAELSPSPVRAPRPKGPTPEKIAANIVKLISPSATGFTAEQLAEQLKLGPEVLQPVLQQVVAEQKVRVVTEGDITTYRRPRIEPIRRRREEPQA